MMAKYTVEFFTKDEINSCRDCRLKHMPDNYESYAWICPLYNRYVEKFVKQNKKPNWCPLCKVEEIEEKI